MKIKNCKSRIKFYLKCITNEDYIKSIRYAVTLANFTFIFTLILTLYNMVVNSQNIVTYNVLYNISLLPFTISISFELLFLILDICESRNRIFTLSTYMPFPLIYIVLYEISLRLLNYLFSNISANTHIIYKVLVIWYLIMFVAFILQRIMRQINLHIDRSEKKKMYLKYK